MRFVGLILFLIAYQAVSHARLFGETELPWDVIILGAGGLYLLFEPLLGAILGKRK